MPSHGSVAKSVRESKEANPLYYCPVRNCLWRTFNYLTGEFTPCGNHGLIHPDAHIVGTSADEIAATNAMEGE